MGPKVDRCCAVPSGSLLDLSLPWIVTTSLPFAPSSRGDCDLEDDIVGGSVVGHDWPRQGVLGMKVDGDGQLGHVGIQDLESMSVNIACLHVRYSTDRAVLWSGAKRFEGVSLVHDQERVLDGSNGARGDRKYRCLRVLLFVLLFV